MKYSHAFLAGFIAFFPFMGGIHTIAHAQETATPTVTLKLGDYRFSPDRIELTAGTPVRLVLVNTDGITPHNFTLKSEAGGLDIDVNVAAGKTREIVLAPQTPGTYRFYCNKKLPFVKSHRARGMKGILIITEPR